MFIAYVTDPANDTVKIAFNDLFKVISEIQRGLVCGIYDPNSILINGVPLTVNELELLHTVEAGNRSSVTCEEGITNE